MGSAEFTQAVETPADRLGAATQTETVPVEQVSALASTLNVSQPEARRYIELSVRLPALVATMQGSNGFAGVWLETNPVRVVLGSTSATVAAFENSAAVKALKADGVTVDHVVRQFTLFELRAQTRVVTNTVRELSGVVNVLVSHSRAEIVVEVADDIAAGAAESLLGGLQLTLGAVGIDLQVRSGYVNETEIDGGTDIPGCTASFGSLTVENEVDAVMTAGHCDGADTGFTFPGTAVAASPARNETDMDPDNDNAPNANGGFDVQHHEITGNGADDFASNNLFGTPADGIRRVVAPIETMAICTIGRVSTPNFACSTVDAYNDVFNTYRSPLDCSAGDSGGPWYVNDAAVGMESFGTNGDMDLARDPDDALQFCNFVRIDQNMAETEVFVKESTDVLNYRAPHSFRPLTPQRILDTRGSAKVDSNGLLTTIAQFEGDDVGAVVLQVAATQADGTGFVSIYPEEYDLLPGQSFDGTSALNYRSGPAVSNLTTVLVSDTREFRIEASQPTHVIIDVVGWIADARAQSTTNGTVYEPINAQRLSLANGTTIAAGTSEDFSVANAGAVAVDVSIAAAGATANGFLSVFEGGAWPGTSALNYLPNQVTTGSSISRVSGFDTIRVYNGGSESVRVFVDQLGQYVNDPAEFRGRVIPILHTRYFDSRTAEYPRLAAGTTIDVQLADDGALGYRGVGGPPPESAQAAIVNITAVNAAGNGFVTIWDAGARPNVSHLNYSAGRVSGNTLTVPIDTLNGTTNLFSSNAVDLIIDIQAWIID